MGVDQNKGIWGSYNPSINREEKPRYQWCQSREGSVVCDTILRRESSKHCYSYISQYFETWREPGTTQAGLTIADFIDIFLKIELIWVVRL